MASAARLDHMDAPGVDDESARLRSGFALQTGKLARLHPARAGGRHGGFHPLPLSASFAVRAARAPHSHRASAPPGASRGPTMIGQACQRSQAVGEERFSPPHAGCRPPSRRHGAEMSLGCRFSPGNLRTGRPRDACDAFQVILTEASSGGRLAALPNEGPCRLIGKGCCSPLHGPGRPSLPHRGIVGLFRSHGRTGPVNASPRAAGRWPPVPTAPFAPLHRVGPGTGLRGDICGTHCRLPARGAR